MSTYTIEYLSSEDRGIVMYRALCSAKNADEALGQAKREFADVQLKYGARGYRVRDAEGSYHASPTAKALEFGKKSRA